MFKTKSIMNDRRRCLAIMFSLAFSFLLSDFEKDVMTS